MTEQYICECECELDVQCEEGTCKKDECESDECLSTCSNEPEEYECCGENCCNNDDIVYDEFGC
jgi:hypothetical protein